MDTTADVGNNSVLDQVPLEQRIPLQRDITFRLARLGESFAEVGHQFFQRPFKTTRFKITRLTADNQLSDNLKEHIDEATRRWKKPPPQRLADLTTYTSLHTHGYSEFLPPCTTYPRRIRLPSDMPTPTPSDLATFISDNCRGNIIVANVLTCLSLCRTNIAIPGHPLTLDALSFLYYRYPHPSRMSALTIGSTSGILRFDVLLTRGGYDIVSDAGPGILDQFKEDVKRLVRLWLAAYDAELNVDEKWYSRLFPRPSATAYGSLIPPLGSEHPWSATSVMALHKQTASTAPVDAYVLTSAVPAIYRHALSDCHVTFNSPHLTLRESRLRLTAAECQALFTRVRTAFRDTLEVAGTSVVEHDDELVITLPLRCTPPEAREILEDAKPFGRPLQNDDDGPRPATEPVLCAAFDAAMRSVPLLSIDARDDEVSLLMRLPIAT